MLFGDDLKTIADLGLGGLSILLWLQQRKVNKAQLDLDTKQNKATADLTTLVREHDTRISALENASKSGVRKPRKR